MKELKLKLLNDFLPQITHAGNFLNYLNLNELDTLIEYLKEHKPQIAKILQDNKVNKFI